MIHIMSFVFGLLLGGFGVMYYTSLGFADGTYIDVSLKKKKKKVKK